MRKTDADDDRAKPGLSPDGLIRQGGAQNVDGSEEPGGYDEDDESPPDFEEDCGCEDSPE